MKIKFRDLPLIVKIATVLTFYNGFVMLEEFVIDRFNYWQYLPFYKKGVFCIWDLTFIFITSILILTNWNYLKSKCTLKTCKICS